MRFSSWLCSGGVLWLIRRCVRERNNQGQPLQWEVQAYRIDSTLSTTHHRSLHQLVERSVEFLDEVVKQSTTSLHCERPLSRNNHTPYASMDMLVARCSWISSAHLQPLHSPRNRQTTVWLIFRRELSTRAGHQPPRRNTRRAR